MPWFLSKVIIRFIFNQISPLVPICLNLRSSADFIGNSDSILG
jgi:hypothetical protein